MNPINRFAFAMLALVAFGTPLALQAGAPVAGQATEDMRLELVREIGGQLRAVAVDGRHVYASLHSRLLVLDAAAPGAPPLAVSAPTGPAIHTLAARDGLVAGIGHELLVWDARQARRVRLVARLPLAVSATDVAIVGHEVWLQSLDGTIRRIDVADPNRPRPLGSWRPPVGPRADRAILVDLVAAGERAALLVTWTGNTPPADTEHAVLLLEPAAGGALTIAAQQSMLGRGDTVTAAGEDVVILLRNGQILHWRPLSEDEPSPPDVIAKTRQGMDLVTGFAFDGERIWARWREGDLTVHDLAGGSWSLVWRSGRGPASIATLPRGGLIEMAATVLRWWTPDRTSATWSPVVAASSCLAHATPRTPAYAARSTWTDPLHESRSPRLGSGTRRSAQAAGASLDLSTFACPTTWTSVRAASYRAIPPPSRRMATERPWSRKAWFRSTASPARPLCPRFRPRR